MHNGVKVHRTASAPVRQPATSNVPPERPEQKAPPIEEPDADDQDKDKEEIREPSKGGAK